MIRHPEILRTLEDERMRKEPVDPELNARIMEAMWEEAFTLGTIPVKDPGPALESRIRMARIINGLKTP